MPLSTPAKRAGLSIGDVVVVDSGRNCYHSFTLGDTAVFHRDDGTDKPLFIQRGHTQYLSLQDITIVRKAPVAVPVPRSTPAAAAGLAEITKGKLYTISMRGSLACITDDVGDPMARCVSNDCFEFVRSA